MPNDFVEETSAPRAIGVSSDSTRMSGHDRSYGAFYAVDLNDHSWVAIVTAIVMAMACGTGSRCPGLLIWSRHSLRLEEKFDEPASSRWH